MLNTCNCNMVILVKNAPSREKNSMQADSRNEEYYLNIVIISEKN